MKPYKYSASDLVIILDNMVYGPSARALALLEDTLWRWVMVHPELFDAVFEFRAARQEWVRHGNPGDPEVWSRLLAAGVRLADQLTPYGDERLPAESQTKED